MELVGAHLAVFLLWCLSMVSFMVLWCLWWLLWYGPTISQLFPEIQENRVATVKPLSPPLTSMPVLLGNFGGRLFAIKNQPNAAPYTIHGSYGIEQGELP